MHNVQAKSILSANNGMNIYRGCLHGCIYCDARSTCYQMKHPFEDVEVKENAPQLLEHALRHKRKKCMIGTGAMSDPYIPIEKDLRITRKCLELIAEYGFGLAIQTKSDLILRDLDLLKEINRNSKCVIQMTMTTMDDQLCSILEPNVRNTKRRSEVLQIMKAEGMDTVCWMTPILPFINDSQENIQGILNECKAAGVYGIIQWGTGLTLREGDREYYYQKLCQHFPGMKEKYEATYGYAYELPSPNSKELMQTIHDFCKKEGIITDPNQIFSYMQEYVDKKAGVQMELFDFMK